MYTEFKRIEFTNEKCSAAEGRAAFF
jgi:hypothetical protein